jgi:hypothetical protein
MVAADVRRLCGTSGVLFPLTPALSLGERENIRLSVDESEALKLFERQTP